MKDLLNRILQLKTEKGLSNSEFADLLDIPRSSVSHLISGRNKPSLDLLYKILECFPEIRTDWLLFGKDKPITEMNQLPTESHAPAAQEEDSASYAEPSTVTAKEQELICLFADGTYKRFVEKN